MKYLLITLTIFLSAQADTVPHSSKQYTERQITPRYIKFYCDPKTHVQYIIITSPYSYNITPRLTQSKQLVTCK